MKAFIAVLLVAAVSGQMTTRVDRNIFDLILRNRQMFPVQGQTTFTQQQQQQQIEDLLTGLKYPVTTGVQTDRFLPSTEQVGPIDETTTTTLLIPSDLTLYSYTLRQLFTLPLFQTYAQLPLFREYINTPAFQLYLTSGHFQKFFTQPIFKQFFADPVLFYKYVYPVVQQYQQYVTLFTQQQQYPVDQQQQQQIVNYLTKFFPTTVFGGLVNVNKQQEQTFVPNYFYKNLNKMNQIQQLIHQQELYNKNFVVPRIFNKNDEIVKMNKVQIPEIYNQDLLINNMINKVNLNKVQIPEIYGQDFLINNNNMNMINKVNMNKMNILDLLMNKRQVVLPTTFNTFNTRKTILDTQVPFTTTTNTFKTVDDLYFEKIVKDLIQGKININDLKTTNVVTEKVNKIVDPVTGDIKIVDEKIVKPLDTVVLDGEMTKEALINKAILLNKNIVNKY